MKVKIINKNKFFRSFVLLIIFLSFVFLCFFNKSSSEEIQNYKTITVTYGDTLWSIAEHEQIENPYYKDSDIRYIIYSIKKVNNLETCTLTVNQSLIIPINIVE